MADFKLGRIKFKWRGNWSASTAYLIDDVIKYGGNTYVCIQNHTSPSNENLFYTNPGTYTDYWSLQSEALFFKGNYADATWYKLNDLVKYGQRQYRCTTAHTSTSTVLDVTKFELYLEALDYKGDWTGSTYYKVNDVFKFGGYQYKVTTAHTSGATADDFDQSVVAVFVEGQQWEDSYNALTVYSKGDIVTYGGYTYIYVNDEEEAGQTPTDNAYWDVVTTGYNTAGDFNIGANYKTGDVVRYGGNSYVAESNITGEYPAVQSTGATNSAYWSLVTEGLKYISGGYSASTTYFIGEVIRYLSSTYVMIKDRQINVTPGTDSSVWQLIAQGSETAVLNTRGDLIVQDAAQAARLPIGVSGAVLTTDGSDPIWSNAEGKNVIYVSNAGDDTNPGSQYLPYKTINKALSVATSGDVVTYTTITGGTGGVPGVYDIVQTLTTGSGTGVTARVVTDGSSVPTSLIITDGGTGHTAGDVITFSDSGGQLGGAAVITITVESVSIGDVIYVKNGVYKENLPLRVPRGVTVRGESLRGTEIQPASGTGTQVATINNISGGTGGTPGTYNYIHQSSTDGSGDGMVLNITTDGSSVPTITIYHGGYGYEVGDQITITDLDDTSSSQLGGATTITFDVATLENNNASNMFLVNNQTNITLMSMRFLTGTPIAGGTSRAAVVSLDPEGPITTVSPYIQDCTSFNTNATGIQIDGLLHSSGNKSILANDFTQINSDGIGVHAKGGGRGEMVSVFTYYCDKSFYAESGGFIRGLNCSSAYGEKGAEADGTLASETPITVSTRGEMLKYDTTTFVGAATESDIPDSMVTNGQGTATITGNTSGATATFFRYNISLDYLHIENRVGNFQQGETITITKEDSSTFEVVLDGSFGDSSSAQSGQIGPLITLKSSDGSLSSSDAIQIGANILFANDSSKYYRVNAVTEQKTTPGNEQATVRLTESVTTLRALAENTSTEISINFSNVRLTGHDFLDIGTGGFADTNYPGLPSQPADQTDEVEELNGGRVYFSSTDQKGDFRVGDLFRIQQATGIATLNADAFDLSGLSELQLGSIGAELGATINEFSTDETLSGDANSAVPTERAVRGYLTRDQAGTGAWVPPTGTTAQRPTGVELYTGAIRFNSSLVTWEGYNGTQWTGLGGGNPWSTITGDGSTTFSAAANDRYFVDTSGGATTITLPVSPLTGDQVRFVDLASTFDTNNLTIGRNGNNINGSAADLTVSTEDAAIGLVYTGATYGWKLIENL